MCAMEVVIRYPEQAGHSSKSGRGYSDEVTASIWAILLECPADYDAPLPTSPSEPLSMEENATVARGVNNRFEKMRHCLDVHYRCHRLDCQDIRSTGGW